MPSCRIETNLGGGNFKAQFRRADRSGAELALVLGDDELARGVVQMKPLREAAGDATEISLTAAVETVGQWFSRQE
jgi:histidyl-tRNA synthetase